MGNYGVLTLVEISKGQVSTAGHQKGGNNVYNEGQHTAAFLGVEIKGIRLYPDPIFLYDFIDLLEDLFAIFRRYILYLIVLEFIRFYDAKTRLSAYEF